MSAIKSTGKPEDAAQPLAALEGVVERLTFADPESHYAVVRLKVKGRRDLVTVVGPLAGTREGEQLQLKGRYEILKIYAGRIKCGDDVDLHRLARGTPMFSGADLAAIINEAALLAAAETVATATQELAARYDGGGWDALDALIPTQTKGEARPSPTVSWQGRLLLFRLIPIPEPGQE